MAGVEGEDGVAFGGLVAECAMGPKVFEEGEEWWGFGGGGALEGAVAAGGEEVRGEGGYGVGEVAGEGAEGDERVEVAGVGDDQVGRGF